MNYIKKLILTITIFSSLGNNVFAAGARITNNTGTNIYFEAFTTSGREGSFIPNGKTVEINAGIRGFDGGQWLYCGQIYQIMFAAAGKSRIEGIEGWRDWNIQSADMLDVGPSGLLAGFGSMKAKVSLEGNCPCDLATTLKNALK